MTVYRMGMRIHLMPVAIYRMRVTIHCMGMAQVHTFCSPGFLNSSKFRLARIHTDRNPPRSPCYPGCTFKKC